MSTNPNNQVAFDLKSYLQARRLKVEQALDQAIPVVYPEQIYEAMRYSLLAGGKRLRPVLCLATCELLGGDLDLAMPTACAMEMVHTMSLIHDDLPSMDNDDFRRGQLTNHKVYGEAMAILAGDALLAFAFEYLVDHTLAAYPDLPPSRILQVVSRLGRAVSAAGLVGGQVVDLACEGQLEVSEATLNFIHQHKTAALLEAAVVCGGILAGADPSAIAALTLYAANIGLAFQIVDDILDLTATSEELGKSAGKDLAAQKATYPSLWGIEASQSKANTLVVEAKQALESFGEKATALNAIADYIVMRKN
ncbi:MAG: polyprenyl synthetase family protein [Pseudanabaenaceae cyanobacterium bins.68]|nr:polyprenyl synthetase family protein [Pseudanabaenaceae cyanobacterium bins.68]